MGDVYVLTNASMPGLVKVGRSWDAYERAAQLSQSTAIPTPFSVVYAQPVDDAAEVERMAHEILADVRVNTRREFFAADTPRAMDALIAAALMSAWNRAGPEAREKFLETIDGPVFDRGR